MQRRDHTLAAGSMNKALMCMSVDRMLLWAASILPMSVRILNYPNYVNMKLMQLCSYRSRLFSSFWRRRHSLRESIGHSRAVRAQTSSCYHRRPHR